MHNTLQCKKSLPKDIIIDKLRVYCALEKPDIVCISETWLCDEIALLECSIQGYHCIQQDRHRRGGGVAMYITDTLESYRLGTMD